MPAVSQSIPPDPSRDDDVISALLHRRDSGSCEDGLRIALVVGGGGMRGAYSGGMAHALEQAGLAPTFDAIYGSSAGAFIGAGLLIGMSEGSSRIFFEDMADPKFIDLRRLRTRRPVVSLDHLLDHILVHPKPMRWTELHASPIPLHIVATAADDLTGHVLRPQSVDDWKLAFRATSSIPFLAGRPVELHGRKWIDGAVSEPLPVARAFDDGSTHVLVLVNRTPEDLRGAPSEPTPSRWARGVDRLVPGLGAMADERRRMGPALALLRDADHPRRGGAKVFTLWPDTDAGIKGLTTHRARVERASQIGYSSVNAVLDRHR
ncbi:patatin family protein [Nakamurella sp. A5-74]|uniref:Patatin family protein n=1 Tax=Nakamurella sp. A5-74 TaxID=3158264 RepID=A0AAU8DP54_9ACTN